MSLLILKKKKMCLKLKKMKKTKQENKFTQLLALLPCYLLSFSYGTNSAFVALLTPQLREDCSEFHIDYDQESWIVSLDNLFTPLICIVAGPLQHLIGPRSSIQLSCLPYILAWLMVLNATDYKMLYASRLMVGVSNALYTSSVYSVEICSNKIRASFDAIGSSFRSLGSIVVFGMGLALRWTTIAKIGLGFPLLALALSFWVPESPTYLIYRKREDRAKKSMKKLYGKKFDTQYKIDNIRSTINNRMNEGVKVGKTDYLRNLNKYPEIYKPFLIIMLMSIVQMFSGASVIRGYVIKIFDTIFDPDKGKHDMNMTMLINATNISNMTIPLCIDKVDKWAYLSGIIIGIFRFASTVSLARLLYKFKRRTMYLISMILTFCGLLCFALFTRLSDVQEIVAFRWLCLAAVCFIVFAVQLGVQTLPFMYSGELFPADVRVILKSVSRCFTTILLMITLKIFPEVVYRISLPGTFLGFAIILGSFFPLMWYILPETKGVDLENVQKFFKKQTSIDSDDSGCHSDQIKDSDDSHSEDSHSKDIKDIEDCDTQSEGIPPEESDTQSDGIATSESDTQSDGIPTDESDTGSDIIAPSESDDTQSEDIISEDITVENTIPSKSMNASKISNNCVQCPADDIQVLEDCEIHISNKPSDSRGY
jgi:MFS family permease